jgi:hypothetical protein
MGKSTKEPVGAHEIDLAFVSLSELIHQHVRVAIEWRRIDGGRKIAAVLRQHMTVAA